MRQAKSLLSRQIDRKVRWGLYRPFLWTGFWIVFIALCLRGHNILRERAQDREWGGVAHQQSEAICLSAYELDSRKLVGWSNTFRIGEKELTSLDSNGCVVGKRYWLTYRIGRTGRLKVESGRLL